MKKSLLVAAVLGLAVCCSSEFFATPVQAKGKEKGLNMAFFLFENSNTFTTYIRKGLENYGKQFNVKVDSFDGKSDQSTQTDVIATALAKGKYDVIVVNPVDSGAGAIINAMCRDADVPVIYADRAPDLIGGILDDYDKAYYVGLSWLEPGYDIAKMVYDDWQKDKAKMDKNGDGVLQYVLIQGNIAQQNAIFRTQAINELMKQWNEDGTMKNVMLDTQDGNWSSDKGKDIMDTWNVKFGSQIEAVICENDTMAMGATESLKTAGAFADGNGPKVYGINGIPDVWELIEQGYMAGTVLTSPYREAMIIIDMAVNICAGKDALEGTPYKWGEFGKDVRVGNESIRLENLDIAKEDYNNCK